MKDLVYLFAAFAVIWGGVLIYVIRLGALNRSLEMRLVKLENSLSGSEKEIP
jgi:CcmD family protein